MPQLSHRTLSRLSRLAAVALACLANLAHAGPRTASADLEVTLDAPAVVEVSRATGFSMTVANKGRSTSGVITARIRFPATGTSPQVHLLGQVTTTDSRCSLVGQELVCSLSALRRDWSTTVAFRYTAPVSTQPLAITASASSTTADPVAANNTATQQLNLEYPARPVTSSTITTRLCTGTALTSFAECLLYPSSIQRFTAALQANQTITFSAPGYTGLWSQNAARTSLKMEFFQNQGNGPVKVSEFNGWAVNDRPCFEGLTVHLNGSGYVSPYEVCMP